MPAARIQTSYEPFQGLGSKIRIIQDYYSRSDLYPSVRALAERLYMSAAHRATIQALFANLRASVRYVADPVGAELIKAPWVMAQEIAARGWTAGDCDDFASLSYSLLKSVGLPAVLAVGWYNNPLPSHIWARFARKDGSVVDFDLCAPYLGQTKPGATRVSIYA